MTPERIDEVAHHYELFGGLSPITELTMRQARGLEERLAAAGRALPVYVGMRNWHPLLADTLKEMYAAGLRHLVSFIAARAPLTAQIAWGGFWATARPRDRTTLAASGSHRL